MNKIYKVKKNAAGHLVACSEFAKGHTKKAVLGSLLIVGALGMATTASVQAKGTGAYIAINDKKNNHNNNATGDYSTVSGGQFNTAKGNYSTVSGGFTNEAEGNYSTVSGGTINQAIGNYSTVSGGFTNEAEGEYSTVAGGANNEADGDYSTVGGGDGNKAKGKYSTIAGGYGNEAKGEGSFAAGVKNKANADNAVALGKENNIEGKGSVAIGSENTVAKGQENVFILGSKTSDVKSNSVLLGHNTAGKEATAVSSATVNGLTLKNFAGVSETSNGTVSVGKQGKERQIVNVGAGQISKDSTDAVNGSQLYALATVVAKNKADIDTNKAATLANRVHIKELERKQENDIKEVVEMQNAIAEQADINKNHIQDLAKAQLAGVTVMEELNKHVEDLYEATNDNLDKISQLDGAVVNNSKNIQNNTQNIEDLAAYNELQDAYAKQQTEAIDALNKASSENTQNIAKNQADIANNINNIYELAQQQDQHSSDIKTLAKASAANTDRIAKNKADADASFETLTKNQNTLIEKDKEHDKLITANKTAIDANKASADTKFAATADAITKNGNAITKNAKSITDLGTKVDAFDGRVTALDTKVNAFDGRITALDSKVENGMAAQAALSGLFQPYSVGKFNATAALGGYGSKSAVAIGAGYRVNPNLAFKAGAAINTSGNKKGSYNIGVNYEF